MDVEVHAPEEYLGGLISDFCTRMGAIEGIEERDAGKVLKARVPLRTMFGYTTALRSMTKGRGTHTMQFAAYVQVPRAVGDEIVSRTRGEAAENTLATFQ